ncbi:MAG: TVP38/TMEM64 family protein [Candidatus Terrybacteria bacterium]|nr:TVP38/TMEM64 family protein [Candidatus Terrybacteria bacterium]
MEEFLTQLFSGNAFIAPVLFTIIRSLAIVFPPIPGIAIDIPGILVFGWLLSFIYAEIGIMLGAMIAFWIARKFREPLVKKFIPLQRLHEWENKLSENQKFWALVAVRLPTNPLFDYISYAAGLTRISSIKFFLSTLIGNVPSVFLVFYFGGFFFNQGIYYLGAFVGALVIFWIVLRKNIFKFSKT